MIRARLPGIAFAVLLLGVLGYVAQSGLRARGLSGAFPAVVGLVGGLAALVNLVQAARGSRAGMPEPSAEDPDAAWLAGLSIGVPIAYAALLWLLGFWVASGVVMLVLPWMLGYRRPLVLLAVAAGTLLAVDVVFVQIFDMRLPQGLVMERINDARNAE